MGLTKAAITRPIFIYMLLFAAFLIGTISYRSMRVEQNPEVSFPIVTVVTIYPGAGPDEINNLISRRIEEAIAGVNGLREITSTSSEGVSSVVAQFELSVSSDVALADVRSKVDAIVNALPEDALKPSVGKIDFASQPVLTLGFSSTSLTSQQLRDLIDEKIRDRFSQVEGVAAANVQGGDIREVQIQLSREKLLSYGIGISDVQRQVAAASINAPAGRIVSGDLEYTVRVPAQFETAEDVRKTVLTVSDSSNPMAKARVVRLSDVAEIHDTIQERTSYSRLNGQDTIVLAITKTREGNAVEIDKQASAVIKTLEEQYEDIGLKITKTFEAAPQISHALADLNFDLTFAIVLVASIVFIFLHNLRGTIIVGLAIPFSIFATFIVLKTVGYTINNMTMLALTLAVGVLVDDAIVVLENIYRHLKMGEDPREAAINGRGEIGLAAIAISLADVVVFLPIATMGGILGQFFKPMAIAYVSAVLLSLFTSFTLTPMLASRWYRAGEDIEHPTGRFAIWFEKWFGRFENFYRRTLEWALARRWFVFLAGNATLFAVFVFIAGSFAPKGEPAAAARMGMPLLFVSIFLGLLVIAIQHLRTRDWKLVAGLGVISLLAGFAGKAALTAFMRSGGRPVAEFPPIVAIGMAIAVFVLVGFAMNLARPVAKTRLLANAAMFGIVFPIVAVLGWGFAQWKDEAVFKFSFFPDTDQPQVNVDIEMPPGTSLAATERVVEQVENIVGKDKDVKYLVSSVGSQGFGGFGGSTSGSNYAQISASLYEKASLKDRILGAGKEILRYRSSNEVVADFTEQIGRIPGARVTVSASGGTGFGSPIQMSFSSEDRQLLVQTAAKIRNRLADGVIEGVINPDISSKPGKIELQVIPDRTMVADAGLSVQQLAGATRTLYQGDDSTKLRAGGKEYVVRVMLSRKDRDDPTVLSTIPVTFSQGNPLYLSDLGTVQEKPGVTRIERRNQVEEVRVTADLLQGYAPGSVQLQIDQWLERENIVPEGVNVLPLGQADLQNRESGYLFGAIGIGLVLVYMLLASLYDNLLYPFIIQLAQPQAMVGAILALIITNKSLNIVGMIGIVTLIGLVGKNAILLVDYTNTLRVRGRNRHDALVEAGPTRLRPILMTTSALIIGVMPIAVALGRGAEFRDTLGITIIGGMLLSTMLTLLVIPCSYTIFDDLSTWVSERFHRKPKSDGFEPPQDDGALRPQEPETVKV